MNNLSPNENRFKISQFKQKIQLFKYRGTFFGTLENISFSTGQTTNVHLIVPYLFIYEELKILKTLLERRVDEKNETN